MTTTTAADNLPSNPLPVGLGNTLQLILLLDGVGVAASLGSVDKLLSKALSNRLDVAERGLTGTGCQEGDGLVDTAERGNIDGLSADGTGGTDTGGVFAGTAVDDGVNGNLDRVLVGHEVDLEDATLDSILHLKLLAVARLTISKAWATMRTAISFFPLLRPCIIRELVRRSMMGQLALRKRLTAYRPAE
jgi:hypothetical protein